MPCIPVLAAGCLIPLPLYPQEHSVPQILNPTPDDGTVVEIDRKGEKTIRAAITDSDTLISQLLVQWSVGEEGDEEDITYLSTQLPDAEGDDLTVWLALDYDELEDHDQHPIELYVSDHDNEVTATWFLTVLGKL